MSGYQNEFVRIKEALRLNPRGMTISEISREINVNRNSVAKYLDVMLISGQVEMRPVGRAKLYYLSHRVPMSAMLNLSSEYIMVLNREYRLLQMNDAFLDFLNIEREAIIGRELKDAPSYIFDDPDIRSGIKKGFDGIDSSKELSFQIDDAELYFRIKFIPTTFGDGEQGVTIIMENITERKKAERALRESEERFRELADLLPQCVYETDERGNFTFANRRALETFGYTQKDLEKGLNVIQTIIPDDVDRSRKNVQRILSGEELSGIEHTALRKDGSTFPMVIYSSPIIRGNKPTGLRGIAIDITKHKRMEEELRKSEEKYRTLYETIRDGIAGGPMDGRIAECNQAFADILGYFKNELKNLTYQQLTPKRWHQMEAKIVQEQILKRGYSDEYEKEYIRKDGTVFPISARVWLVRDEYGKPKGMWGIVRDITERKRMEEELSRSETKYRNLVETSNDIIYQADAEGNLTFMNANGLKAFEVSEDEIVGKPWAPNLHPEDLADAVKAYKKMLETGESLVNYECRFVARRGKGKVFPVIQNISVLRDKAGNIIGTQGIARDITERRKAQK